MRIAQLSNAFNWSGGAQQMWLLSKALAQKGHALWVICPPGSPMEQRCHAARLEVWPLSQRQDYDVPSMIRLARFLKERRIDILHAHHPTAHAIGLGAAYLSRVPAFCVTRRVIFPVKRNPFSRLKYLSRRINGYVAVCEAVKTELAKAGVKSERVVVVPSAVANGAEDPSREEGMRFREALGLSKTDFVIGTVANHSPYKGLRVLLDAAQPVAAHHPRVHFLIVGRDTERLAPAVAERGLGSRVTLAGFRTDIPHVLAALDLFVLPSLQEAAATALREAMIQGLPVIGTRVGGIPEAIHPGETGLLVPPGDAGALAQAMRTLIDDAALRERLARQGKAYVEKAYALPNVVERMETFYESLLGKRDL